MVVSPGASGNGVGTVCTHRARRLPSAVVHVVAVLVAAALIHVAIVRVRLPLGVLVAGAVAVLVGASLAAPPQQVWHSVVGGVVVLVAMVPAVARRQVRMVAEGLADITWQPGAVAAGGERLVQDLQEAGFLLADDGWARADALDWCLVALRRGPLRVLVVSSARGPTMDVTTVLDNGRILLTTPSARARARSDVVRQCVPTTDPDELLARHEAVIAAAVAAGRSPVVPDTAQLTAAAIADERLHSRDVLAGGVPAALVTMWRELTGTDADVGEATERPDAWARLVAEPGGSS